MNKKTVSISEIAPLIVEKLNQEGFVTMTVTGNSMLPFFVSHKTEVTLSKPMKPLRRGDIVLYQNSQESYILHRIICFHNNHLIIRGDALYTKEVVKPESVIGIVVSFSNKKRETSVRKLSYRLKVALWGICYPLRRYLLSIHHYLHRREL